MDNLLSKLNYKENPRICILNGESEFKDRVLKAKTGIIIDDDIEPKYLYGFVLVFVKTVTEIIDASPKVIHNLTEDGVLWIIYPKKSSRNFSSEVSRDYGWDSLLKCGFGPVRQISVDSDWSALRFRNVKFIKSRKRS